MIKYVIIGLTLLCSKAQAQVINWVDQPWKADINVYFTNYKYEADIIIFKTNHKWDAKEKPGYWYWREDDGEEYDSDRVNIFPVEHKWQADYVVYLTTYAHEIKLTDKYINEIWEQ